jgi:hypothetical protein
MFYIDDIEGGGQLMETEDCYSFGTCVGYQR